MKELVIIPARGGSKGIPKKNIKLLIGKPLISYTIETAREIFKDEDICVSTDSEEIIEIVEKIGLKVPFIRPLEFASDTSSSYEVIEHALSYYKKKGIDYDRVILLQPTSPFRNRCHVEQAIDLLDENTDMVVSVCQSSSNPYYNLFEESNEGFLKKVKDGNYTRRQDCPVVYEYNGSIYVIKTSSLRSQKSLSFHNIKKFIMPEKYSIDIDSEMDWKYAELLLRDNVF